jgi:hypothetical protein
VQFSRRLKAGAHLMIDAVRKPPAAAVQGRAGCRLCHLD